MTSDGGAMDDEAALMRAARALEGRRILIVSTALPNFEAGTGPYFNRLMLERLRDAGAQPEVLVVYPPNYRTFADPVQRARWREELEADGFAVGEVDLPDVDPTPVRRRPFMRMRLRRRVLHPGYWRVRIADVLWPRAEDLFREMQSNRVIAEAVSARAPDGCLIWCDYGAGLATAEACPVPYALLLGDLPHLPPLYRRLPPIAPARAMLSADFWRTLHASLRVRRVLIEQLARHRHLYIAVERYAEWARRRGIRQARFVYNLIPDLGGTDWRARREAVHRNGPVRVMLLGNVDNTATRAGLRLFARRVLPVVERLGPQKVLIDVCGNGALEASLAERFEGSPVVRVRGFVEDVAAELTASDILFVPTPVKLGGRVRIVYAWSTGVCVVAHRANQYGLPAMIDGETAALAGTRGLAGRLLDCINSKNLRETLGYGGRARFESEYSGASADARFLRIAADLFES